MAILRAPSAERFCEVADCLVEGGIRIVEFALRGNDVLAAIEKYARRVPDGVALGAGTVLTASSARQAVAAGATYLVSPALVPEVLEAGSAMGVPVLPGALTPTEVQEAWTRGAAAAKIFPASVFGPQYIKELAAPLPHVPVVPTGGIALGDIHHYLAAGAIAVGLGSHLLGDALTTRRGAGLKARVSRALAERGECGATA